MKFKTFVFAIGLMLFASFALAASPIGFVKNGNFSQCTYRTVGNAVDSAFENPRWESGTASDGQTIVNVQGIVTYDGKRYNAMLQFGLKPGNKFDVNGLSMNGKVMSADFKKSFITQLCK